MDKQPLSAPLSEISDLFSALACLRQEHTALSAVVSLLADRNDFPESLDPETLAALLNGIADRFDAQIDASLGTTGRLSRHLQGKEV